MNNDNFQDLYDEFGTYIGPELNEDEFDDPQENGEHMDAGENGENLSEENENEDNTHIEDQVILYEDKKYYRDMDEVYKGAETLIMEEDAQALSDPLIKEVKPKQFDLIERKNPRMMTSLSFLKNVSKNNQLIRNVSLVGHLHHGKTTFMDILVEQTHEMPNWTFAEENKYTDTRKDEQERKISIKSTPMTLILPDSNEKSYLFNIMDTPGHPNFSDEVCCSLRLSDGAVLVVDAIEGVMVNTERIIKYIVQENQSICVVINKIDRLVLEMKIPPSDAYQKLKHTLEEVNGIQASHTTHLSPEDREKYTISPLKNNVIFAANRYYLAFSLKSFASQYKLRYPSINSESLSKVLWGDYYYNSQTKKFLKKPTKDFSQRTFVQFIQEPMYKIMAYSVSYEKANLEKVLSQLGIYLRNEIYRLNTKELLIHVCRDFFGDVNCFVDMVAEHVPSPAFGTKRLVEKYYTGKKANNEFYEEIKKCDKDGELCVNVVKMYNKQDCLRFDALGRVVNGTLTKKNALKVMGENYSLQDEEDMQIRRAIDLYILEGRYRIPVDEVYAGNWVLIEGIDQTISKTATIVSADYEGDTEIFRPIKFEGCSFFKLAIEPQIPSELPKMLEGLRKVNKSYPLLQTKVEESGEHLIIGTGELYLDSVMHDLRNMYSEIEIKVSDPCVTFCETVIDSSAIKCTSETPNKANKFTMVSEPMDKDLVDDIEAEKVDLQNHSQAEISKFFEDKYSWDILAAKSVWAFGPDTFGPNILMDDTLPFETNKEQLSQVRESQIHGFQWSTREGPLCEEPIRNVKFKLMGAEVAANPIHRAGGQIIPTSRRVCYSSFLMANPRILEPNQLAEIMCSGDCLPAVYNVQNRRRGHLITEQAKPGSPLYIIKANIPALDSFGFETDLR